MYESWYGEKAKGQAGGIADTTLSRVETLTAGGNISFGSLVKLGSDGKTVTALTQASDIGAFAGVAVASQKEIYADGFGYHAGDVVPVLTFGDVFVKVEANAKRGQVFTVANAGEGGNTVKLTPVAVGTENAFDKMMVVENGSASDVVVARVL